MIIVYFQRWRMFLSKFKNVGVFKKQYWRDNKIQTGWLCYCLVWSFSGTFTYQSTHYTLLSSGIHQNKNTPYWYICSYLLFEQNLYVKKTRDFKSLTNLDSRSTSAAARRRKSERSPHFTILSTEWWKIRYSLCVL